MIQFCVALCIMLLAFSCKDEELEKQIERIRETVRLDYADSLIKAYSGACSLSPHYSLSYKGLPPHQLWWQENYREWKRFAVIGNIWECKKYYGNMRGTPYSGAYYLSKINVLMTGAYYPQHLVFEVSSTELLDTLRNVPVVFQLLSLGDVISDTSGQLTIRCLCGVSKPLYLSIDREEEVYAALAEKYHYVDIAEMFGIKRH